MKNITFFLVIFSSVFMNASQVSSALRDVPSNSSLCEEIDWSNVQQVQTEKTSNSNDVTPPVMNTFSAKSIDFSKYDNEFNGNKIDLFIEKLLNDHPVFYQSRYLSKEDMAKLLKEILNQNGFFQLQDAQA